MNYLEFSKNREDLMDHMIKLWGPEYSGSKPIFSYVFFDKILHFFDKILVIKLSASNLNLIYLMKMTTS